MQEKVLIGGLHEVELHFQGDVGEDLGIIGVKGVATELIFEMSRNMDRVHNVEGSVIASIDNGSIQFVNAKIAISSFLTSKDFKSIDVKSEKGKQIMRDLQLDF